MRIKELKEKTQKELLEVLHNLKKEQLNSRFQASAGEKIPGSRINLVRKSVARIKTLLRKFQLEGKANA